VTLDVAQRLKQRRANGSVRGGSALQSLVQAAQLQEDEVALRGGLVRRGLSRSRPCAGGVAITVSVCAARP